MDHHYHRNDHNTSRYSYRPSTYPAQLSCVRKYSPSQSPIVHQPCGGLPLQDLLEAAGSMEDDTMEHHDDFMLFEEVDLLECVLDEHRLKLLHAQEHILHLRMDILQAMMTLKDGRQKAERKTQKQHTQELKHLAVQQQLVDAMVQPKKSSKSSSTTTQEESRQDSPPTSPLRTSQQEQEEDATRAQKRTIHSVGKMNAFWTASPTTPRDFPPSPPTASRLLCYQRFASSSSDTSSTTSMSSSSSSTIPTSSPRKSSFRQRRVSSQDVDIVSPRRVRFSLTMMVAPLSCPVA